MKNRVHHKKEPKIEICYQGVITAQLVVVNLQLAQGTVFDESDNANSMGMLSPSEGISQRTLQVFIGPFFKYKLL